MDEAPTDQEPELENQRHQVQIMISKESQQWLSFFLLVRYQRKKMLKREIKFEDFNGDTVTEIFYFNISKPELVELEVEYKEGFGTMLEKIVKTEDHKELIKRFKEIVLLAYGQKSDDGKHFIKSDEIREEFSHSAAYSSLFMELATDDNAAIKFIRGILPKDMVGDQDKPANLTKLQAPPTPPTA